MDMAKLRMDEWLPFVLTNFNVVMFALAMIFIIFHRMFVRHISENEIIYRWMAVFALGCTLIYTFVMHAFYPNITAISIGWPPSPFQYEVAIADLAFGVLAILSFRASYGFRLATVVGNTIWLWGDAIGHIIQMVTYHNFSVGNAGSWFWMDIIIPIILIICLTNLRPGKLIAV